MTLSKKDEVFLSANYTAIYYTSRWNMNWAICMPWALLKCIFLNMEICLTRWTTNNPIDLVSISLWIYVSFLLRGRSTFRNLLCFWKVLFFIWYINWYKILKLISKLYKICLSCVLVETPYSKTVSMIFDINPLYLCGLRIAVGSVA